MKTTDGVSVMVQGRIVWTNGDLFKGQIKTVFGTKQPMMNEQGEPIREYGFGLAVPKTALTNEPNGIWVALHNEAQKLFPQGIPPGFSMKFKDGDGIDDKGAPFSQRTGYAGHIVIACSTCIPIKFFMFQNNQNVLVNEGIKCGDYVNVQLSIKAHGPIGKGKAGLYVNPMAVQLVGYGEAIINVPSGNDIFGTAQPNVPQGASATPVAANPNQMLVTQPVQAPAQVTPNFGVLPQAHQPVAQPVEAQAPTQAAPTQAAPTQAAPSFPQQPQGFPQPAQAAPQPAQAAPQPGGMPMPPGFNG